MHKLSLALLVFFVAGFNAEYTTFQYNLCHNATQTPAFTVYELDTSPTPLLNPGVQNIRMRLDIKRPISGPVKSSFNIIRTVLGLSLPFRCFFIDTVGYIGSCDYDDLCEWVTGLVGLDDTNCPDGAAQYGIDCTCPFSIPAQSVDLTTTLNIPDFSSLAGGLLSFLNGDYTITLNASDDNGYLGCINTKITLKKAPATL